MAMIHVVVRDSVGKLVEGMDHDLDETQLQKKESTWEDDDMLIKAVEYCLLDCPGNAHKTGLAQGDGSFCELHVHRSVDAVAKRWPTELGAEVAKLT